MSRLKCPYCSAYRSTERELQTHIDVAHTANLTDYGDSEGSA